MIGSAGQQQPGQVVEQRVDVLGRQRRQRDGQPAGHLDGAHVGEAQRHLGLRRARRARTLCTCSFWRISETVTPITGLLMPSPPVHRTLAQFAHRSTHVSLLPPFCEELTTSAPGVEGDPREPAGQHVHVLAAGDRERAQIDVARLEARRRTTVGWRESMTISCATKRSGASLRARRRPCARPRAARAGDHDAVAAVAAARLDHELVDALEDHLEHLGLRRVVGRAPSAAAAPRRGSSGPCPRRSACSSLSSATPVPNALTQASVPARTGSSSRRATSRRPAALVAQAVLVGATVERRRRRARRRAAARAAARREPTAARGARAGAERARRSCGARRTRSCARRR